MGFDYIFILTGIPRPRTEYLPSQHRMPLPNRTTLGRGIGTCHDTAQQKKENLETLGNSPSLEGQGRTTWFNRCHFQPVLIGSFVRRLSVQYPIYYTTEDLETQKEYMAPTELSVLLDSLLALLRIKVPRGTQPPLVLRDQRAKELVLPDLGDGLTIALRGPRARVQLGPVDLLQPLAATRWKEGGITWGERGELTYSMPLVTMK